MIVGWSTLTKFVCSTSSGTCRRCSNNTEHYLVRDRFRFSLFFIPVVQKHLKHRLVCPVCKHSTDVSEHDAGQALTGSTDIDALLK